MKGFKLLDITQENDTVVFVNWTHCLWRSTVTEVNKMPGHGRTWENQTGALSFWLEEPRNDSSILMLLDDFTAIRRVLTWRKGMQERRGPGDEGSPQVLALGRQGLAPHAGGGAGWTPAGSWFSLEEVLSCSLRLLTVTGSAADPVVGKEGRESCGRWLMGWVPADAPLHTSYLHQGRSPRLSLILEQDACADGLLPPGIPEPHSPPTAMLWLTSLHFLVRTEGTTVPQNR